MQLTIELPETIGERLKSLSYPNEFIVKILSQHLITENPMIKPVTEITIKEAIEQLKTFHQGHQLHGLNLKELIEEGRH